MAKSSYLSNVLKSIKYATIDTVAEMNPVIVEQYSSNKDFVKETIDNIKSKSGDNKTGDYVKNTIKKTYKNLKEDLLSGNFYNKTRIEQEENAAMEKVFGLDFSSFDGMDDAFNESDDSAFNMDWDSDDSFGGEDSEDLSASDKYTADVMAYAMGQTTKAIKKSNSKSTRALGGLMVETSKFNADVIAASTEKMLGGIGAASGIVHNDLSAVNANLGKVIEFTDSALRTHIENSTTFYETQKQQMQEQTDILKEIRDMQSNMMNPKKKKDNDSVNISDIFGSEGSLDLRAYKDYLKQNKRGFENTQFGMLGMLKDFGPLMMASLTGSPLSVPLKALIKKAIPQAVEDAFTALNETIAGVISTSLVNLTQASKTGRNGAFFQFLGDMFGLQIPDLSMDMSKYNKDVAPWTGKDHKALTEVIPTWLSKIYSGITGKEEQRFDYDKGKFITASDLKKSYDKEYNSAVAKANYSINKELTDNLNKIRFSNQEDKKAILDAIEKIEKYNFKEMKNFNPNSKRSEDLDPKTYGIDGPNADKVMQIVRVLYGNVNKRTQMKGSNELLTSISDYNKDIREREVSGEHVFNALFNGSLSEKQLQGTPIMASAERLDTTNHLLQSILDAVSRGGSSKKVKRKKNHNTKGKKVKTTVNTDETTKTEVVDATSFDINVDDPEKITEMLENAEPQDITETYVESIQKAESASDKLKAFFSGFALLTKKPAEFLKNTINTVDTYAYSLFFGNGEEDVHSISQKIAKGFDDVFSKIGNKVSTTFKAIKEEVTKEGKTTANGLFKAMFGVDLDQYGKEFKKAMFGDENKPFFQGMGETIRKGFGEIMDDIFGPVKKGFKKYFGKDKDEDADLFADLKKGAKTFTDSATSAYKKGRDEEKARQDAIDKITKGEFEGSFVEAGAAIADAKQKEKQDAKKATTIQNAAAGLKVTKTGLVAVSEGERIIPKYMNAASIAGRQLKENGAINKFRHSMGLGDVQIANFAEGGTVGNKGIVKEAGGIKYQKNMTYKRFNDFYNSLPDDANKEYYRKKYAHDFSEQTLNKAKKQGAKTASDAKEIAQKLADDFIKSNPALADAVTEQINTLANSKFVTNTKKVINAVKGYAGKVGEEAKNAGKAAKEAFFSDEDDLTKSVKYLAERFAVGKEAKETADDVAKNWKKYLPKSLAGAGIGAGLSVLFGLAGGPLLGAAVGAATALTSKSNAVQKLLFGEKEVDEEGNVTGRKGNLFSKQVSTAVQKYAPDMAKGGALGGILASLPFMPGGPITGIMVGSAIGFAKNNEQIKNTLFGEDSILKDAPKIIKQKLPKMGLGALTGALMGPFGLTTNLMIGSAIGFASDNEKFRGLLLGTKGIDGKYGGGLIGFIKNSLSVPVKGLGDLIDETREFFNKEIFEPLKRAGKVLFRQFENIFYWIGDKVADTFTTHVWKPIGNLIAIKLIQPLEKVAGFLFKLPKFLGKNMIKIAMSPIKMISDRLEARQLSKVGGAGGTAQDRILQRQQMLGRYEENATRKRRGPFKGIRQARAQWKYDRLQNRFNNSEANLQDQFMAGSNMDREQLEQMLLVNESLGKLGKDGDNKKAIDRYAKATLSHTNLNEILNSHVARKQLSEKQRKFIIEEVSQGRYQDAVKNVANYTPMLTVENRLALCKKIKEVAEKVKKGIEIASNARAVKEEWKEKYGISIGGAAQRRQIKRQLESMEIKGDVIEDPEKITEGLTPETTSEKFLFGISKDVHAIAEAFYKKHEEAVEKNEAAAQVSPEILNGLGEELTPIDSNAGIVIMNPDEKEKKDQEQYQYTEDGMVKMKTNDQGELIPDQQDSQTRETLKNKKENDDTQKGILAKLTGIGTGIAEFFGKKKEKKETNIFEKILSTLGIGFSFLGGGSKIFGALKAVGAIAGIGYLFGKKVQEKDDEGNAVFDEYGNPVYKSIANIIGSKIGKILGGVKDWWLDKAWPAVKDFAVNELFPTIGEGFKNIWDGLGDISENILNWVINDLLPESIKALPKILGVATKTGAEMILGLFGIKPDDSSSNDTGNTGDSTDIGYDKNGKQGSTTSASSSENGTNSLKSGSSSSGTTQSPKTQDKYAYTSDMSDSDIKKALSNSEGYKKTENNTQKAKVLNSNDIRKHWNDIYTISDGSSHTLGELMTTSGYYIGTTDTGDVYSEDLFKSPRLLYEFTNGDIADVSSSEKERNDNTNKVSKTALQKTPYAVARAAFTKGQLPNFGLRAAQKINAGIHGYAQWMAMKVPVVGKYAAGLDKIAELGTFAPLKITEVANNYFKNKAAGLDSAEAINNAAKTSFKKPRTPSQIFKDFIAKRKNKNKATEEVVEDAVDEAGITKAIEDVVDDNIDGTNGNTKKGLITKITGWLENKLKNTKLLSKIASKINTAACKVKNFEDITNAKLKDVMYDIIKKIIPMLGKKSSGLLTQICSNIGDALGTAGTRIIADAMIAFGIGMKDADANFGVQHSEVTFPEMLISGITNMINATLLFGLLDTHEILEFVENAVDGILDLSDLKKRQAAMEAIVKQFNDENHTKYDVYDYIMQDKIQSKIDKFLHSRPLAAATGTVEGLGEMTISGGTSYLKTVGYGALGAIWNLGKSGVQSVKDGTNFWDNLSTNFGNYKKTLSKYGKETNLAMSSGTRKLKDGWYYTATGIQRGGSDSSHDGTGGSFGKAETKPKNSSNLVTDSGITTSINNQYPSLLDNAEYKSLDLMASQYGLSKTDFTGETSDYKDQADKNRQTVANLNGTWESINKQTTPFFNSLSDAMTVAQKALSKNIAVALGLADADDEDVDFIKLVNDQKYMDKRTQTIQDNSTIASLFAGYTGSNSNSDKKQSEAALKVSQAAKSGTLKSSKDSAITSATKSMINSNLKNSTSKTNISVRVSSAAPQAAAFGSGINGNDVKDVVQNTPPSENEFVSQKYGKYANKTFGIGTQKEKVSDAGCAPSTAVMTINSNLGNKSRLTMEDALKHASGYIADNGGVTPDYFADEFRRYGFKTAYVAKSDEKQKDVMKHQLMNGKSIVLMGRNTSNNSKRKSPFGPNYHYVVATGISADGKYVYISDPEAKTPNVKYAVDEIFNNTDLSIIPVAVNGRIADLAGRLRTNLKQLSGKKSAGIIFVGDSRTEGMRDTIGENNKTKFVCKSREGLKWLKNTGYTQLKELCEKYPDYYVVFNFGINDLNIDNYISYYKNTIAKNISNKIIHMSINPIDETKAKKSGYTITNSEIEAFNKKYKEYAGNAYLNGYRYLKSKKFNTSDGIHYDSETYKKLYNKVVDFINGNGGKITAGVAKATSTVNSTSTDTASTITTSSGKHIKSFSDLISAIGSILSGSWGLSSSESSDLNGSSSSSINATSTISTDGISGRVSSDPNVAKLQKQLVAQMKSVEGTLRYAQGNDKYPGSRNPEDGSGDCSSTVQWAYKKVTGKDIGDWTGAQNQSSATTFVEQPHAQSAFDDSKLQLGDILLYGNDAGGHVEMYYGNGKTIGHGNPSKLGPTIKDLSYRTNDCWSAKRLNEFMPSGKGTGLFISQKDSKYRSKKIGDETVEQAGCAPAVATMAIDNTKEYNMDKAIKDAKQYKNNGEGVTADYFINTFKKQGYNTIVLTNKKKIINMLKQGNNAVLIGQDANNKSKRRSPFGPNSHYVLATGISRDEKLIYISDPENSEPNIRYNTNTVLNAVKVAIVPIHSSSNSRLNAYTNKLSKALQNYNGKATVQNKIVLMLSKMEAQRAKDKKNGTKWKYSNADRQISKSFSGERGNGNKKECRCNGPKLVLWALRMANMIPENSNTLTVSNGRLSGSAYKDITNNFSVVNYSKEARLLINNGTLKPGDIVTFQNSSRIMIYGGSRTWYDGGSMNCKNGEYVSWKITSNPSSIVNYIIRQKSVSNKSTTTSNTSSLTDAIGSTTSKVDSNASNSTTTTDGTTSNTSSNGGDTFLDKLVNSFALLAEGWGLTSGQNDTTTETSSSSTSSDGSSTSVRGDTVKTQIWNYFKDKGIPEEGIAGVMGNIQQESDFTLDCIESCYKPDVQKQYADDVSSKKIGRSGFLGEPTINGTTYGPGYGLVQWTDDERKGGFYDATVGKGLRIDSAQGQLDCLWDELNKEYPKSLNALKSGNVETATLGFMNDYERPNAKYANADGRVQYAKSVLQEMKGKGSGLGTIGIGTKASSAISSINNANSENESKDKARLDKLMRTNSGLNSIGIGTKASSAISSISRNKTATPKLSFNDFAGKGSGVDYSTSNTSSARSVVSRSYSVDTSSSDTNTLLGAIIKLLAQAVDNTASIQSIADAVVTLVDTKAANVTDVETKKQLLDTKAQMLNLIRQQNTTNASTSLGDLISDMEAITSR